MTREGPEAAPRYARQLRGRYPTEGGVRNPSSTASLQRARTARVS